MYCEEPAGGDGAAMCGGSVGSGWRLFVLVALVQSTQVGGWYRPEEAAAAGSLAAGHPWRDAGRQTVIRRHRCTVRTPPLPTCDPAHEDLLAGAAGVCPAPGAVEGLCVLRQHAALAAKAVGLQSKAAPVAVLGSQVGRQLLVDGPAAAQAVVAPLSCDCRVFLSAAGQQAYTQVMVGSSRLCTRQ